MIRVDGYEIKAVAFDMDGLMFDTERLAQRLWTEASATEGWNMGSEVLMSLVGQSKPSGMRLLAEAYGPGFPYEAIRTRRLAMEAAYFRDNEVPLKPGLLDLVGFLESRGIPMAVATSTQRYRVLPLFVASGLLERFSFILCGDEVIHTKPSPEMYLKTAERLGMAPASCLVLEDSPAGIAAAHAAGAIPVMVPDLVDPDSATREKAARVFGNLGEVLGWLENGEGDRSR